jgi:hypothetical protein
MATLLKVLNNLADIKSAGGVALRVRTQAATPDTPLTPRGVQSVLGQYKAAKGKPYEVWEAGVEGRSEERTIRNGGQPLYAHVPQTQVGRPVDWRPVSRTHFQAVIGPSKLIGRHCHGAVSLLAL